MRSCIKTWLSFGAKHRCAHSWSMTFHSSSQKCCLCIILNSKVEPVFVYEHKVQARLLQTNVKKRLTDMYYTEGMPSGNQRLTQSFRALRPKTKPEYMGHL